MNIINYITNKSNSKNILIGIAFVLFVNIVIFPLFLSDNVSVNNILDLHFGFSKDEVLNTLLLMQQSGRKTYLLSIILIDTPCAIGYGFVYAIIIAALLKNNITKRNQYLTLTPFLISFFDILENTGFVYFILNYPAITSTATNIVSLFNQLKWIFAEVTFLIVLFLSVRRLIVKSVKL